VTLSILATLGTGRRRSYEWIEPSQAAARLGVTVRDVYRLIDAGALPAYRIDNQIRLLAHEVDELRRRWGR
jgi:excisionase family DNA binding protein